MNPYRIFAGIKPLRVIAGEILEFDGSFDLPKVSAIGDWVVARGLMRQGKLDRAIAAAERATETDPSSIYARAVLSRAYAAAHRNDDAEREYRVALADYQSLSAEQRTYIAVALTDPLAKH